MHLNSSSRIAILDLTHGGIVLARKFKNISGLVTAIDVYGTLDSGKLEDLEKEGIKTSRKSLNAADFDVIVAPVHLDIGYPMLLEAAASNVPVISHHQAVGYILSGYDIRNKILVELTGTRAKTSTAVLLADILSRKKRVVSHTSRGLEDWSTGKLLRKGLSITPASILSALEDVQEAGIKYDIFIAEISLGGTGRADVGIITTIANNYPIANNTRLASDAKRRIILDAKSGSSLVVNNDALRFFGVCRRDIKIISFTDSVNASCNVYYENIDEKGGIISYFIGNKHGKIHINGTQYYDITSYKTAFVCASAATLAMGVDHKNIENTLAEFKGAEGRMNKKILNGKMLIDNSNSGMDIRSAEKALEYALKEKGKIIMILGEEAKEVCEGLDPAGVRSFMDKHLEDLAVLILVGERMKVFAEINSRAVCYAKDLKAGMDLAMSLSKNSDIVLSCVKCFR